MSGQNTITTLATDAEVKRPLGTGISRQFYRDKSAQGLGTYRAMDENGAVEIVGGPGAGVGGQLSAQITYNAGTRVLTATPVGGTVGANSYVWRIASSSTNEANLAFTGASTTNTQTLAATLVTGNALVEVRATDSLGRIAYATFFVRDVIVE